MRTFRIILDIGFTVSILILLLVIYYPQHTKTLVLPEEICQAEKGDHMQYHERNDTVFLEFTFPQNLKRPQGTLVIQGQQLVVGDDLDYKQNDLITVSQDTIKLLWDFAQKEIKKEKDSINKIKKK